MKRVFAVLLLAVFSATGCATKQLTREEALTLNAHTEQARFKTYEGIPKERIIAASEKALKSFDSKYEVTKHFENGFYAKRRWMMYLVLAFSTGEHDWKIAVNEEKGNSVVELRGWMGDNTTASPLPISTPGRDENNYFLSPSLYKLLYSRIDYFLGVSNIWISCSDAESMKDPLEFGDPFGPLCTMVRAMDPPK